ncbi:hypothetical protein Ocin01_18447 [Orchesella cincta]|uniref:Uncharacterized protein n=1 Tax=Orchesella cincta TaxID=48709 RepID=A0A1D2M5I5_ORCCI|nr:hypothetical protein Ocin01_18447 [Orchesella cincta]
MGENPSGNTSGNGQPPFPNFSSVIPGANLPSASMFLPPNGALCVFVMGPGNANVNVYASGPVGQIDKGPGSTLSGRTPPTVSSSQQLQRPSSRATYNAMRMPRGPVQSMPIPAAAEPTTTQSGQENRRTTRSQTKASTKGRKKT